MKPSPQRETIRLTSCSALALTSSEHLYVSPSVSKSVGASTEHQRCPRPFYPLSNERLQGIGPCGYVGGESAR